MTVPPAERAGLRKAVKFAGIGVAHHRRSGLFLPWSLGVPYPAEAVAVCLRKDHPAPDERCTCGFHAARDVLELLRLLTPQPRSLVGMALLDVELGGVELAGPRGLRAAEQRVLGARLFPWCIVCGIGASPGAAAPRLCGVSLRRFAGVRRLAGGFHPWIPPSADAPQQQVAPLCESHATQDGVPLTLADVSGLLRTEVTWMSAAQRASILTGRVGASEHDSGTEPGETRVADLATGQAGFVAPTALRLIGRRLCVDAHAHTSRGSDDRRWVLLRRATARSLELMVRPGRGPAFEAAVLASRSQAALGSALPVARVWGLHRCPRLAAAMKRHRPWASLGRARL